MNTASEPYRTALLITMSISYSRYFSTAMPMATYRHKNARFWSTVTATEFVTIDADQRGDHEQRGRREPLQLQPLLTRRPGEPHHHRRDADHQRGGQKDEHRDQHRRVPPWLNALNGCDQKRVARTIKASRDRA